MKIQVSNEMKSRLIHAATNGSDIAKDVLAELKKNRDSSELIRGCYNFFSTKRKRSDCSSYHKIRIVFTACNKNLCHENFPDKGNPNARWFPENRTELEPSTFIGLFKELPEYDSEQIKYFCSAISLDSEVSIKICSGMNDFYEAYCASNYIMTADTDCSTLHNSCMRYEDKARNAADFYANFAGARIMVAKDNHDYIIGRAVIWDNVRWERGDAGDVTVSLIDRVYTSHSFVAELMMRKAKEAGINLRKQYNDYSHARECIVLNPTAHHEPGSPVTANLALEVPVCRWHKKGVPYLDTFLYLCFDGERLELRNRNHTGRIATCQNTDGIACRNAKVCPLCNTIHSNYDEEFCPACKPLVFTETVFGRVLNGPSRQHEGVRYPAILFRKGRPIPAFRRYLQIQKLYKA